MAAAMRQVLSDEQAIAAILITATLNCLKLNDLKTEEPNCQHLNRQNGK